MPLPAFPSVVTSYSIVRIPTFDTVVINYGGKNEQRVSQSSAPRWRLKLRFVTQPQADADSIINFFIARKGKFEAFTITDERGTVYTVRFSEDSINIEYFSYQLYNFGVIEFLEVAG